MLKAYIPILEWLPRYSRALLERDLTAGIVVAVLLVPQSMAYAMLAGLPPYMGLYGSVLPLLIYAALGTSPAMSVGPITVVSLMTASALAPLAAAGSAQYVAYATTLALLGGLLLLALGLLRLGFLSGFLSHPVLAGFVAGVGLTIVGGQLRHVLGVKGGHAESVFGLVVDALSRLAETNWVTLAIGLVSIAALVKREALMRWLTGRGLLSTGLARHVARAMPLILVVVFTTLSWGLGLATTAGVRIVGAIPPGLPPLALPSLDPAMLPRLLPSAIAIALVGFLEAYAVAKSIADRERQRLRPDQELIGLGLANLGAAVTGAYPVNGGTARTVVNHSAGAATPLAGAITGLAMMIVLLGFTGLLYHLPLAVLSAVVISAALSLVTLAPLRQAWAYDGADGLAGAATLAAVLALGVEIGLAVGIIVSIGGFLLSSSRPRVVDLEVDRPDTVGLRVEGPLFFASATNVEDRVLAALDRRPGARHAVLSCAAVTRIDSTAVEMLEALSQRLAKSGGRLILVDVSPELRAQLGRAPHLAPPKGHAEILPTLDAGLAVLAIDSGPTGSPAAGGTS